MFASFNIEQDILDYKTGKFLSKEFLEKFHNKVSKTNKPYLEIISTIKKLLNKSKYVVTEDLIYVKNKNIKPELFIYVVRMFNLTYRGEKIIVVNDSIAYIPTKYDIFNKNFLYININKVVNYIKLNLLKNMYTNKSAKKKFLTDIKLKLLNFSS